MAKWLRYNSVLGCQYEIPEKEALRRINSRRYVRHFDDYWQRFTDTWFNAKDPWRDIIFKVEEGAGQ